MSSRATQTSTLPDGRVSATKPCTLPATEPCTLPDGRVSAPRQTAPEAKERSFYAEAVYDAIKGGAHTQEEIIKATKLTSAWVGRGLATLILEEGSITRDIVEDDFESIRVYYLKDEEEQSHAA